MDSAGGQRASDTDMQQQRQNSAMFLQYMAKCMQKSKELPLPAGDKPTSTGNVVIRTVNPRDLAHLSQVEPRMYPPEFSTKDAARKSFKRYGHWKKVDYRWVILDDITVPNHYEDGAGSEVRKFWIRYLQDGVPIPAIRVYSEERLTLISDGVQRFRALKQVGFKYALVYFRYETSEDPPQ